jgi:PAS domain S-box-containing protein
MDQPRSGAEGPGVQGGARGRTIEPAPLPRAKILVVDDDERNAFAAVSALEELGHEIIVARSGEEALRRLLDEDFAVILLDLHMPGMDGYETAAFVRKRRRTMHTPIVFLTAVFRDEAHLFQAYSAGAVDVVFKPIDPFILRSKVQVLVELHMKTLEVQLQAEHRQRLMDENARVQREKLQAELALRRTQERQEAILKALPIAVHARRAEPPFQPLFISHNVQALTGYSVEDFMGQPDFGWSRVHPDDVKMVAEAMETAVKRGAYSCEFRWLCADGEYRRFMDQGVLGPADEEGASAIFGTMLDVTERRSLEEQLAQSRRMEVVGQLTGGVAHDFNNLLTVILGNVDLMERRIDGDEKAGRQLAAVRFAAERGRSLTGQLLAFSRRQHLTPVTLDVNALIDAFFPLLKQAVGEAVKVELELTPEPLNTDVDEGQLEAALLNLAVNARDAMTNGGAIKINTRRKRTDGADWVQIEVVDTGPGIPPDVIDRIFEPFFTTKEVGKGSGLGLSQVYGFVQQSGGRIGVDSRPGHGARFRLLLPRSDKAPAKPEAKSAKPMPAIGRGGRLLVVEDDGEVMGVTVAMLEELGYEVSTACNAATAIDVLKQGGPLDLMLSDVVMPGGRNGVELAHVARDMRPDLKVLLSSGYAGAALLSAGSSFELIDKPYDREVLAAKLCALLDDREGRGPAASTAQAKPSGQRRDRTGAGRRKGHAAAR